MSILCLISSFSVSFECVLFDVVNIWEVVFMKQLVTVNEPAVTVTFFNCHLSFFKLRLNGVFTIEDGYE